MADTTTDLFAPPSPEELQQATTGSTPPKDADLFAPPTQQEMQQVVAPKQEPAEKPKDLFAPPTTTSELQAAKGSTTYEDVEATAHRPFFSAPIYGTEPTTDSELNAIAKKHNVSPEAIKDIATYFGAVREGGKSSTGEQLQSSLGRGVGFNIPQLIAKKQIDDPNLRAAVDDVQDLADAKRSFTRAAAENLVPITALSSVAGHAATGAAEGLGKLALKGSAEGAGFGAAGSLGRSKEGEELSSTAQGAAGGAVLGGAVPLLAKAGESAASRLFSRIDSTAAPEVEKKVAEQVLSKQGPQIDQGAQDLLAARKDSEQVISRSLLNAEPLDPEAASTIVQEQIDPDLYKAYMDPSTEEGQLIRKKIDRLQPDLPEGSDTRPVIEQQLANDLVSNRARDFAQDLTRERPATLEEAQQAIQEYASRQGEEATVDKLARFNEERAALEYIDKNAVRAGRENGIVDNTANFISDSQFVLRDIDERFGTSLEPAHQLLNQNYNRMSLPRNAFRSDLSDIFKNNQALDAELTKGGAVYDALASKNTSALSTQEMQAYQDFSKYFDNMREYAASLASEKHSGIAPLPVPDGMPKMLLNTNELTSKFADLHNTALEEASDVLGRQVTDLAQMSPAEFAEVSKQPATAQLLQGLSVFDDKIPSNGAAVSARYKDLVGTRKGNMQMQSAARTVLESGADIPDWMREKNLYKLADKWAAGTLKQLYLRKPMDLLRSAATRVSAAGGDVESSYVNRLLQDIRGVRPGTMAELTMQGRVKYQAQIDRLTDGHGVVGQAVGSVAKALPDILSDMTHQVMPNLMGMSPRSVLRALSHTFVKTAPELGSAYGRTAIIRGFANTMMNYKGQMARVLEEGYRPDEFVGKYAQSVSEGIRRSSIYAMPSNLVASMGKAAMVPYKFVDHLNRAWAMGIADTVAHDLVSSSKGAQSALARLPTAVQRAVASSGGNEQLISKAIADHLIAGTVYHYNRLSMSEYGRTMGPLFSAFSKWPTATAGDLIATYRQKGLVGGTIRNADKFIVPLVAMQLLDMSMFDIDPEKPWSANYADMSDTQKKIFSSSGMSESAPINTLKAVAGGNFFTPPVVDAVLKGIVLPTFHGNGPQLMKGVDSAIQNFTPGSVWVRFITDDMLTYMTGEKPEGSTFVERTGEGLRRLNR